MPNQALSLPVKAVILTVQFQRGELCIWYKCNPYEEGREERYFHIYGTGAQVVPEDDNEHYIATVQQNDGAFIWHIYESPTY